MAYVLSKHESKRDRWVIVSPWYAETKDYQHPQSKQQCNLLLSEAWIRDDSLSTEEDDCQEHGPEKLEQKLLAAVFDELAEWHISIHFYYLLFQF